MDWIIERISADPPRSATPLPEAPYTADALDPTRCRPLPRSIGQASLAFIDGGQAILFEGPSSCAARVRAIAVHYAGAKRCAIERVEHDLLVQLNEEGGLHYTIEARPALDVDLRIPLEERSLSPTKVSPVQVVSLARLAIEAALARKARRSWSTDAIVLDGTLHRPNQYEQRLLTGLDYAIGIAKTSSWLTTDGRGLSAALLRLAPSAWSYPDVWRGPDDHPRIWALKLHPKSRHILRTEFNRQPDDALLAGLAALARDSAFPGYPYPLIDADRLARIGERERTLLRCRLQARAGKRWEAFAQQESALDAHSILDTQ